MNKLSMVSYLAYLELKRRVRGVRYFAEVDVTDNCNLRCAHCYHFHGKDGFVKAELPLDVWAKRFDELYNGGIRLLLLVGGEPALRKDVLMLAHKKFPMVYVITNGTIHIPVEFDHLLFVSLDGMHTTNDSIRGGGTFSRVMDNYSGDPRVAINMTITMANYKELADVVELSAEKGFRGVVCNICATGAGADIPMAVKRDERRLIMDEMRKVKATHPKQFLLSDKMLSWYEAADHRGRCYWGDDVRHFDVAWNARRCFGTNADCSNCGCLAGAFQNPLAMALSPREFVNLV